MRIANLGRNLRAVDEGSALRTKPFAKDDLARSATVGVRSVEPANADATRMIEQLKRLLLAVAGAAQARRGADPPEIAAAEDNPVDVALAQHDAPSPSFAKRRSRQAPLSSPAEGGGANQRTRGPPNGSGGGGRRSRRGSCAW